MDKPVAVSDGVVGDIPLEQCSECEGGYRNFDRDLTCPYCCELVSDLVGHLPCDEQ